LDSVTHRNDMKVETHRKREDNFSYLAAFFSVSRNQRRQELQPTIGQSSSLVMGLMDIRKYLNLTRERNDLQAVILEKLREGGEGMHHGLTHFGASKHLTVMAKLLKLSLQSCLFSCLPP
jgi:hypothetical protein